MKGTLTLNASMEINAYIPWERAVTLVLTGRATPWEEHETERVRSQHLDMAFPTVIVLKRYVHIPYTEKELRDGMTVSFRSILKRDDYTCMYCGSQQGLTVDHVHPKSRGGRNTWDNLVACCSPCNSAKADRTPKEAGMKLLREPYVMDRHAAAQRAVWKGASRLQVPALV